MKSPWYTQFQSDLKFSSHIFIVGYSLSDYHISALLLENPLISDRTFFIQPNKVDENFSRRTKTYGKTVFIGIDGFAKILKNLPKYTRAMDLNKLKSFRILDPFRDKKGLRAPTAMEVFNLFVFGTFNYTRCAATLPSDNYVIPRTDSVELLVQLIAMNRSIIVDGRLGNGKTTFMYIAFLALAERRYKCVMFTAVGPMFDMEVSALKSIENLVILFKEYASAQDVLPDLSAKLPNAKFIVEIRTPIFEVRYHEVSKTIPEPYKRISLNRLSDDEMESFKRLCTRAGISVIKRSLLGRGRLELREILLLATGSEDIKKRIEEVIKPVLHTRNRRRVLIFAMLLRRFHLTCDSGFIRSVTGVDPYHEFRPIKEISDELFETEIDDFRVRSAILSDFVVRQLLDPEEVCDCVVEAAQAAAARKSVRVYRVLMANLLQYSHLSEIMDSGPQSADIVVSEVYERLRWDQRINDEPLFWLQYAIALSVSKQCEHLGMASQFIETAYERAAKLAGFETYQIDTQAFRIFLLCEIETSCGKPVVKFDEILKLLETLNGMLGEDSQRGFVFGVLENVIPFVQKRKSDMSVGERNALTFWLSTVEQSLEGLPPEYKARYGSENIRRALGSAKRLLLGV